MNATVKEICEVSLHGNDRFEVVCGNFRCSGIAGCFAKALESSSVLSVVKSSIPMRAEWRPEKDYWRLCVKVRSTPKLSQAIKDAGKWT